MYAFISNIAYPLWVFLCLILLACALNYGEAFYVVCAIINLAIVGVRTYWHYKK